MTWAEAAKQQKGLSLLANVLGQDAIASQLPSPGQANTLLAPTDNAFFNMLTVLGAFRVQCASACGAFPRLHA